MNILLINPSQYKIYGSAMSPDYPPLGLGYLGAILEKEGHKVKVLDIDAENISKGDLITLLKNFNPLLVGITCTTPTYKNAVELGALIKNIIPTKIVLGGIHPTIDPENAIKAKSIDMLIIGEGEKTIKELAEFIEKNETDFSKINGLVYKKENKIIINNPREMIQNLDELPFPARHLFGSRKYTYPDALYEQSFPIFTSRGCPGQCTYCCSKQIFCGKFRYRSAKNIVDEIEYLIKKYGAKEIHMWDDCFTLIKNRVFEVRNEFIKRKIKIKVAFPNGLRVDMVDPEILKALKEMGTYSIAFGVESGNQDILNKIKKGTKIEQIIKAFKETKKLGIEIWGFFMIGLPGETKETIMDTINFAIKLNPDIAKFHILKPYPGSEAYHDLLKQNLIMDYDYSNYGIHIGPVHRLPTVSKKEMMAYQKLAYRKFYLRPSILLKQLKRIKSWNRFKLNMAAGLSVFGMMFKKEDL
jgi:anaerobic magnesium-protoporphyrin IX monomethyl ester cyclase